MFGDGSRRLFSSARVPQLDLIRINDDLAGVHLPFQFVAFRLSRNGTEFVNLAFGCVGTFRGDNEQEEQRDDAQRGDDDASETSKAPNNRPYRFERLAHRSQTAHAQFSFTDPLRVAHFPALDETVNNATLFTDPGLVISRLCFTRRPPFARIDLERH